MSVAPDASEKATDEGEAVLLSNTRQLTFEGRRSGEGYFDRSGTKMVFQSEREPGNPFYQIYLMDLETGDTFRISPGTGKTTCGWIHPSGQRVFFASTHDDPEALEKQKEEIGFRESGQERRYSWDYDEHFEIYSADPRGGDVRRLTRARGYDAEGSLSPDGRQVVFASNRHAYSQELSPEDQELLKIDKSVFMDLYLMNADGSNVRRLTDVRGYDGGPFFSHDGSKITWRRFSEDGVTAEIYTMNPDGSGQKAITRMGAMSWAPFFHPSGDYLIFATNKHGFGNFELYLVDAEGKSEPVRVTHTDGFDGLATFSPDGQRLAWTSNRTPDDQSQIFLADWNHEKALELLGLGMSGADAEMPLDLPATQSGIAVEDLRQHVAFLAADRLEGRLTGTAGERMAGDYIARVFASLGLLPAGEEGTYFHDFEFTSGVEVGKDSRLRIKVGDQEHTPVIDQDWRPLSFSKTGAIEEAEVVFAGYGIVAPEAPGQEEYDSYVHLDVQDKWVLMLRYMPEDISSERRQHLARHASLRYKAMVARDRGAKGILVASGPTSQVKDQLVDLSFDASMSGTSVAAVSISDTFAAQLLGSADKDLESLQKDLDGGDQMMGFAIPSSSVSAHIDLKYNKSVGRNVLALMPAGDEPVGEAVAVGAHMDHLGHGEASGSLARAGEKGQIHNGADDNASGVAGMLEIAQYLAEQKASGNLKARRDVLFAAWSGEELGLLGSSHYVNEFDQDQDNDLKPQVTSYLNLDMIGRLREELVLQGIGSSSVWNGIVERRNVPVGLSLSPQDDSYLPTDATSFYLKKVPILSAFTGAHEDYHTPRDTADKLNYAGMRSISRFMALVVRDLVQREESPDYVAMEEPEDKGARAGLRAYLGTIPDYAPGDVKGLQLSGVSKGSPSDQAGLQAGDLVVELAGRTIENIYDYTYAIDALKIGETVDITIVRDGQRMTFKITPTSRE
ncbi:MAG TPA: M28 family peptidase [Acidobacteriota bacterium]|nr:M28 family peptidase [Acidobacteriota bacterium]